MPQVINTNVPSLIAQNNLDKASGGLSTSFERLSSGLRINSAKDDAAGLAIATRFTSTISGLTVAKRNANDAISLAQVAEGSLAEITNMLQRCRELAIQSANDTNSGSDRQALQSEVNQLQQEMQRIALQSTFNGINILDGSLQNAQFQIGSEANQTVDISITNVQTSSIGANELATSNPQGIQEATHRQFLGGGFSAGASGLGTEIGVGLASSTSSSGYAAETLTVTNYGATGLLSTQNAVIPANTDAKAIATTLSGLTGVSASAFNKVTISSALGTNTSFNVNLSIYGAAGADTASLAGIMTSTNAVNFATIATAINSSAAMQALNVYAVNNGGTSLDIYAPDGHNISLQFTAGTGGFKVESAFNGGNSVSAVGSNSSYTRAGRVDVALNQGYAISSSLAGGLFGSAGVNTPIVTTAVGLTGLTGHNAVGGIGGAAADQVITISGSKGSKAVTISAHDTASNIATKINAVSALTNVTAKANTTVTLDALSADGTISFDLFGQNATATSISAAVTQTDLSALMKVINDASGNTGITAKIGSSKSQLILTQQSGDDIQIANFTHTAAVTYQEPSVLPVGTDGSTAPVANVVTMNVTGNAETNVDEDGTYLGAVVTLKTGGTAGINGQDCTVIGGQVVFSSADVFSMSSEMDGVHYIGSLFGTAANAGNTSTARTVNEVDISDVQGANSAISVLDNAMTQVSSLRADLGAIQSRFDSVISTTSNTIANLSAARARVKDADFAAETANLSRQQILMSAGMAILSQANQLPQNVLQLLK